MGCRWSTALDHQPIPMLPKRGWALNIFIPEGVLIAPLKQPGYFAGAAFISVLEQPEIVAPGFPVWWPMFGVKPA